MASVCPVGVNGIVCQAVGALPLPGGTNTGQVAGIASHAAGAAAGAVSGDILGQIASSMASAADGLLKTLSTFWMNVDIPQLDVSGSPVAQIQGDTSWIVTVTAVTCILVAAARMAIRRRGAPTGIMLTGLVRLVLVSGVATLTVEAAGKLGDSFSSMLLNQSHLGSGGWSGIISTTAITGSLAGGDGMLLIISLLIIFSSLIQLMLMILRVGLLVILTGTLPLAAAASMSEWGETWWRRHIGWLAAWLLYKPAAALLYAAAFALTDGKRTAVEVLSGFMLLILSVLILPALLKVIVPMTASLGASSSGTLALGTVGALATGAIKASALGSAGAVGPVGAATAAPSGTSPGLAERTVVSPSHKGDGSSGSAGQTPRPTATRERYGSAGAAFDASDPRPASNRPEPDGSQRASPKDAADPTGPSGAADYNQNDDLEMGG